jgi:branched-chain amino acid transport system permease protein
MILGLLGMTVNLLVGYTGMITFGHAAFYGIGAYALGLLLKKTSLPFSLVILLCPLITACFGLVIGWFCVRLVRFYFAMLTLAIGQFVWGVILKWYSFTGGDSGLVGIPVPALLSSPKDVYYLILAVLFMSIVVMALIIHSPFGMTMRAIRENPERVRFLGIYLTRYRLSVFVLSTFFAGLAGGLYVVLVHGAFPEYAFWAKSGEAIIVALIGGIFFFMGPLIGAAVLIILQQIVIQFTEYWSLVVGILLLVVIFFFPSGVSGIRLKTDFTFRGVAAGITSIVRKLNKCV